MAKPWRVSRSMFLDEEEAAGLLKSVRDRVRQADDEQRPGRTLDRLLIEGLMFSGLKSSEFCRLRAGDTIVGTGRSEFRVPSGHGGAGRTVFIPHGLSVAVIDYFSRLRPAWLPASVEPEDLSRPLIHHERKRPFERTGLYRRVVRILTESGFGPRASVHLLRHTYGYLAYVRTGGNLLFVQRQLGHAHPMLTSVYAAFAEESYADLAETLYGVSTAAGGEPKPQTVPAVAPPSPEHNLGKPRPAKPTFDAAPLVVSGLEAPKPARPRTATKPAGKKRAGGKGR